jgi:hypothetical protein
MRKSQVHTIKQSTIDSRKVLWVLPRRFLLLPLSGTRLPLVPYVGADVTARFLASACRTEPRPACQVVFGGLWLALKVLGVVWLFPYLFGAYIVKLLYSQLVRRDHVSGKLYWTAFNRVKVALLLCKEVFTCLGALRLRSGENCLRTLIPSTL